MLGTKYADLKPITEEHGGLILSNIYKNTTPIVNKDDINLKLKQRKTSLSLN